MEKMTLLVERIYRDQGRRRWRNAAFRDEAGQVMSEIRPATPEHIDDRIQHLLLQRAARRKHRERTRE